MFVTQDVVLRFFFRKKIILKNGFSIPINSSIILAPTHRSRWDGLILTMAMGRRVTKKDCRFMVTKSEMQGIQGWFLKRLGCFSINQLSPSLSALRYAIDLIEKGEQANLKDFEKESANFFEACLPIEEIARRGVDTMRYGPLKSIGLWNPKWGDLFDRENRLKKRPHAVVQLRKEDLEGKLLNMVGFQTNLKWSEQKRIFRLIPGLEKAEFVRFGVMHRNTFLESPKLLLPTLQFLKRETLFAAGQITGTEGYAAAAAGGLLAGINASLLAKGKKPVSFPTESMIGSLINFISNKNQILSNHKKNKFQPMPASFGLVPELTKRIKDKKLRYKAYQERSTEALNDFKNKLDSCFDRDHLLSKIY